VSIDEDLKVLETLLMRLRLDYEKYFLGSRPREPVVERREVNKQILYYLNNPLPNTAARFKFNSVNARYQAFKRHWDNVLRQMEAGTYKRDVFRANLREKERAETKLDAPASAAGPGEKTGDLFETYVGAAQACGQKVAGLTPQKLQAVIDKQRAALTQKLNCSDVVFKVVIQEGKVKLKASPVR
jgi:hypothetical protein